MDRNIEKKLPPAEYLIASFGSGTAIIRALKEEGVTLDLSAISHWKKRGRIPQSNWVPLLRCAEKKGLLVTADHLLNGGKKWVR